MVLRNTKFGTKELTISLIISIVYAGMSLLFDAELDLLFKTEFFQNARPMIFILAMISIFNGPVVGGLSAGLGTLIFDVIKGLILQKPFDLGNWVGIVANLIGGLVAGTFARSFSSASTVFDFTDDEPDYLWKLFGFSYLKRLVRNIVATTLGFAIVVGAVLGYGQRLIPDFTGESFDIFTSIAYSNGIYLLAAVPIFYILTTIVDYYGDRSESLKKERTRNIPVISESDKFAIEAFVPRGDEIYDGEWGAMELTIKNMSSTPEKFSLRVSSNDVFAPARHLTPTLKPGEEDKMYFSVYALSPGPKHANVYVEDREHNLSRGRMNYIVGSTNTVIIRKIMGLFLVAGLIFTGFSITQNLLGEAPLSKPVLVALVSVPIEMVIIYLIYWINGRDVTKKLMKSYNRIIKKEGELMLIGVKEGVKSSAVDFVKKSRIIAWIFLVLAAITIVGVWGILVYTEYLGNSLDKNGGYLIYSVVALLIFMLTSQIYLDRADDKAEEIKLAEELKEKVILSAVASKQPVKNRTTQIEISLQNPFKSKGMRIYLHTIDHISPTEYLLDIEPDEQETVALDFTPLDEGKREITFEIVPYRDSNGKIIAAEATETFDQESIRLKAAADSVFGLSPTQISILKKIVAGVGAISIAFSAVADILSLSIDPRTVDTSIPLILIFQSPVFWFYLYFQNKSVKRLESIE